MPAANRPAPLTRRRLLQAGGMASGALAMSPLLAACGGGGDSGSATPSASASPASSGAAASAGSITYAVQAFAHDAIRPIVDEFTEETGIEVVLEGGPASGQDLMSQLIPAFNAGTTPYDVVDADDPAGGAFAAAGWLHPLDDVIDSDVRDDLTPGMVDGMAQWNESDGATYRMYHNWEIGYYWIRRDVLAANGLDVPTTWQELVDVGTEVKERTGMWAFADAASKPGLTFVYMAYLAAQAGADLYTFDDATREAFQYAHDLIHAHELFPEDALTWTYDQQNAAYLSDQLLSMRQWTFFDGVASAETDWYDPEKVARVAPLAGPGGAKTWAGGWGYAVPEASEKKEQALEFVRFMSRTDIAVRLAEASSFFITARSSVLDALGDDGIVATLKEYAENDWISPRPFHPQAADAETVIDDVAQSYLTDQISLDEAMQRGIDEVADLA